MLPICGQIFGYDKEFLNESGEFFQDFLERFVTVTSFWEKPATRIMKTFLFERRF